MPLSMTGKLVTYPGSATLGTNGPNSVGGRLKKLEQAEHAAAQSAAKIATDRSRSAFKYIRPPAGAQRPGRSSTGGRFPSKLDWKVDGATGQVGLDIPHLEKDAPHWLILEIGTGARAKMRFGGDEGDQEGSYRNGVASPSGSIRSIRSQRGRRIHPSLVFADGPGGSYTPAGAATGQQLFVRSKVTGAPRRRFGIVIKREIKGQHFVQKGAQEGFQEYRRSVLSAARESFRHGSNA